MNSPIFTSEISTIECPNAPKKIYPYASFPTPQAGPVAAPRKLFALSPEEFQTESPEVFNSGAEPSESQINAAMDILNKIPILDDVPLDVPSAVVVDSKKKCTRVVYRGQKRQRKCGREIYKDGMCRYHRDKKHGLIKNKNGNVPCY